MCKDNSRIKDNLLGRDRLATRSKVLIAGSLAHGVHDGLTDVIYVLLPVWQAAFGLSYAQVGLLRGVYAGMMAGFQLLASKGARRWGQIPLGASTQHPLASAMVSDAFEGSGRVKQALAQYNFAGDIGKAIIPGGVGFMLIYVSWQASTVLLGMLGVAASFLISRLIPNSQGGISSIKKSESVRWVESGAGLKALIATGFLDSGVRMGFLTFLPFLLQSKGADTNAIGLALALLFIGGAFGKLVCGYLGARLGPASTVLCTEMATAMLILISLLLPYRSLLALMPLVGVVLNGTSSVLSGLVPSFAPPGRRDQIFAWFYTGTVGGGALAPVLMGAVSDKFGITDALVALAWILLLTLPLCLVISKATKGMVSC